MSQIIDDLLLGVSDGSHAAFVELHRRMRERLIALAVTVVRDHALAEDVVQDVLTEVWERASRFDADRGSAVGWLLRLTRGRAVDRVRIEEHARARGSEWGARALADTEEPVDERLDLQVRSEDLRVALDALSAPQREAIVATHLDGHTYREVAVRLGVPVGTVKTRAHDGMIRLRVLLGAPAVFAAAPVPAGETTEVRVAA